jgi:predicted nucleic acid-binding protein
VITYFDTSAFVPLLVQEAGSALSKELWDTSDSAVSSHLLYVETAAALARAARLKRLSADNHAAALRLLDALWPEVSVIHTDTSLLERAAVLTYRESLRAYDAVHCASAESVSDRHNLVVASGDKALLAACSRLGMATANTAERKRELRTLRRDG